jgi:hypothetical protein
MSHPIDPMSALLPEWLAPLAIATHHLEACSAQINGYWDDADQFHETIRFHPNPFLELVSSSLGVTSNHNGGNPWINLRYALKIAGVDQPIGELVLVLNDNLEVIDENWLIDVHSPYVLSTR